MKKLLLIFSLFLASDAFAQSAPTLVSYTETAWNTAGDASGNKTVTVPSFLANDILVAIGGSETNSPALAVPTASGLTFTSQKSNSAANTCASQLATATAGAGGTNVVVTMNGPTSGAGSHWGFAVWVWRNSTGIGNSAEQHTTTDTVSLTPTGAHGGIMWASFDFNAGATGSLTPTPTDTRQNSNDGTHYTFSVADLTDQASSGAVSYGTTASGGPFSIVVLEIKNTGGGGGGTTPPPTMQTMGVGSLAYNVNQNTLNAFQGCAVGDPSCTMRAELCDENLNCLLLPVGGHRLGLMFSKNGLRHQVATITFQVTAQ